MIRGVGTTGSGRELIGEFVGADTVNDEITAHKTGAIHVSSTLGGEPVDTIFEIGGQDSKFISIEDGVVVDFAMNEACAAGTGVPGRAGREAGHQHQGRVRPAGAVSASSDAAGRALHGVHGARRHRLAAQGRDEARPGGRTGLLDRAQLPQPRGARPQDRRTSSSSRAARPTTTRSPRRSPASGQEDHRPAAQRRDRRDRHGSDRAPMASGDRRRDTFRGYDLTS